LITKHLWERHTKAVLVNKVNKDFLLIIVLMKKTQISLKGTWMSYICYFLQNLMKIFLCVWINPVYFHQNTYCDIKCFLISDYKRRRKKPNIVWFCYIFFFEFKGKKARIFNACEKLGGTFFLVLLDFGIMSNNASSPFGSISSCCFSFLNIFLEFCFFQVCLVKTFGKYCLGFI